MISIYGISIRRGCGVFKLEKSMYFYISRKPEQAALKQKIKDIAYSRVHYGYRRIHTLLSREGLKVNHKRVYRLYKEQELQMRRKKPKRRVQAKAREDRIVPTCKNDVWSMDFVSDALFTGEKIRILTIVDAYTRESPGIGVGKNYKGTEVVKTLMEAMKQHGVPKVLRVDNGPEFVSKELDLWAYAHKVTLDFSRPGKPTDNAYIESFNSRFRQECLNQHWFLNMGDATTKIKDWLREYNSHRPHSSLGYQTPQKFAELSATSTG